MSGSLRVWDGTTWRYASTDRQVPTYESIKAGASTALMATTTTCTKSANVLHAGSALTLTGSTTGRNGTLEFYHRVGTGAWVLLASRAVSSTGPSAPVSVSHTPSANGTSYYVRFAGSLNYKASSSAPTPGVTVQTLTSAEKIVPLRWARAYNSTEGTKLTGSGRDTAIHQGYYSATHGNRKSLLSFAPALPAGAKVSKVTLVCSSAWANWHEDGGTIVVGSFSNQTTEPTFWNTVATQPDRSRKAVGTPSWDIDLTSWAATAVVSPTFSGLTIGPGPSTSPEFFGYSVDAPMGGFQLRIQYEWWSS